jgi:hypothetical protein
VRWNEGFEKSGRDDNGTRDDQGLFVDLEVPIPRVRRSLIDSIGMTLCFICHLDHVLQDAVATRDRGRASALENHFAIVMVQYGSQ